MMDTLVKPSSSSASLHTALRIDMAEEHTALELNHLHTQQFIMLIMHVPYHAALSACMTGFCWDSGNMQQLQKWQAYMWRHVSESHQHFSVDFMYACTSAALQ